MAGKWGPPSGFNCLPFYPVFREFGVVAHSSTELIELDLSHIACVYDEHLGKLKRNLDTTLSSISQHGQALGVITPVIRSQLQGACLTTGSDAKTLEQMLVNKLRLLASQHPATSSGHKRPRPRAHSQEARVLLETFWEEHSRYPSEQEKEELIALCGMTKKQITTWFHNKKARDPKPRTPSPGTGRAPTEDPGDNLALPNLGTLEELLMDDSMFYPSTSFPPNDPDSFLAWLREETL